MTIKLSDYEFGWFIGILEGEGCLNYNGNSQIIDVHMTDEDSVISYSKILSKILEQEVKVSAWQPPGNRKKMYGCLISGERARIVMRLVLPYMSQRRQDKIRWSLGEDRPKFSDLMQLIGSQNARREYDAERDARDAVDPDDGEPSFVINDLPGDGIYDE
jgi:hypothetical protein